MFFDMIVGQCNGNWGNKLQQPFCSPKLAVPDFEYHLPTSDVIFYDKTIATQKLIQFYLLGWQILMR
jgi:hypothetical protein